LVDLTAIADDGVPPGSPLLKFDLLSGGPTVRSLPFEQITQNGVWGKPSKATVDKGHAILAITIPLIRELLHAHWPDAPGLKSDASSDSRSATEAPVADTGPLPARRLMA